MIYLKDLVRQRYAKVIDRATKEVIASGYVIKPAVNRKVGPPHPIICIAFDFTYHFSTAKNDKFVIFFQDEPCEYTEPKIPPDYLLDHIRFLLEDYVDSAPLENAYVYTGWGPEDIDADVLDLVNALTETIDAKTISSCSGHNKGQLWVDIQFDSIEPIKKLVDILEDIPEMEFVVNSHCCQHLMLPPDVVQFKVRTLDIGEKAYEAAGKLIKALKEKR